MRLIGTIGSPPNEQCDQSMTDACDEPFFTPNVQVLGRKRLNGGEQAKLRRLIQGPVAKMTAEQLSIDLDTGLENDPRYAPAIANLYRLVLEPGSRLEQMLSCLQADLPANASPPVKVLVVEAVARQLGREWSDDVSSFVDVSIATVRLQDLAQALAQQSADDIDFPSAPFATIVLPEEEQHGLMSYLTGALFRAFGWQHQVLTHDANGQSQVAAAAAKSDVICIGWSNIRLKPQFRNLVTDIRLSGYGKNQPLIVGGIAALNSIDFLVEMGIDCICDSAYSAVRIAENFNNLEKMDFKAAPDDGKTGTRKKRIDWRNS